MNIIYKWLCSASLSLNTKKTKYIHYSFYTSSKTNSFGTIKIRRISCVRNHDCHCDVLEKAEVVKYLGIYFDKNINWKYHITYLTRKLRFGYFMLCKQRRSCSRKMLRIVYFSFFQSHIQYCVTSFGGAFPSVFSTSFNLQKNCLKIISNVNHYSNINELYVINKILPIKQLYYYRIFCYYLRNKDIFALVPSCSQRLTNYSLQPFLVNTSRGKQCLNLR